MSKLTRRKFVKTTFAAGLAASILPTDRAVGANSDIRVAIVGFNSRGKGLISGFQGVGGVRVAALCDADSAILNSVADDLDKKTKTKTQRYTDVRKLLKNKDIDVVAFATPVHWNGYGTLLALDAGKDVYVEKPVCHTLQEGRLMLAAARKKKLIVQAGTQNRSDVGMRAVVPDIQAGKLGKIEFIHSYWNKPRGSIGKVAGPQTPPASVDYDVYVGPAPKKPLMRKRFHYDWHWQWDFGAGEVCNLGNHQIDLARWTAGIDRLPDQVFMFGGRAYDDDGQTPNTVLTAFLYNNNVPIFWESRNMPAQPGKKGSDPIMGTTAAIYVKCEGGYFVGGRGGGATCDNAGKLIKKYRGDGGISHFANFIEAVRSRKHESLRADIAEGRISTSMCHLANISYKLGKVAAPDDNCYTKQIEAAKTNPYFASRWESIKAHLKVNKVDVTKTPMLIGAPLQLNPKKEVFTGPADIAKKATALAAKEYRKPFTLPG
ncbi:MAG: Gfo/Idh/MocA family oxidoreductase [Phycisphaerae bacterium]|nr:Gfo/Idh/MocA family oxidoreductase [Planctomycetota bacterium]MBL7218773.1 Gfo/Idh/MocA family oxidoreductase [Phycisphaerae bacterium]